MTVTRRSILKIGAGLFLTGASGAAYARYMEPGGAFAITRHRLTPPGWTPGLRLRLVALTDLHSGGVHMPLARIAEIVDTTHALEPDAVVLLGDYITRLQRNVHGVSMAQWSQELARLRAPLGVHAVLGNHEFWDDPQVQRRGHGEPEAQRALHDVGLSVMQNTARRLVKDGHAFWIAGLGDQLAFRLGHDRSTGRFMYRGLDDLPATLGRAADGAPVILLAHEPDVFARMPELPEALRPALTLSGHTHGGQVRLLGWSPHVPSAYGGRFAYGHIREEGRDLVVSAGLGTSGIPIRFGAPPEIVVLELG
ncbi:MAG: metallophosphoesterase [Bosea sp.]|jgi:predicted MPP superfamily phosphohydrolase|nr:metallophosphoesterase [Bosea sp. (in: a-proteobacteria)]